jgi:hypothetical protein
MSLLFLLYFEKGFVVETFSSFVLMILLFLDDLAEGFSAGCVWGESFELFLGLYK